MLYFPTQHASGLTLAPETLPQARILRRFVLSSSLFSEATKMISEVPKGDFPIDDAESLLICH